MPRCALQRGARVVASSKSGGWWPGWVVSHDSEKVLVRWADYSHEYEEAVHEWQVVLELFADGRGHGVDRPFREGDKVLALGKFGGWWEVEVIFADQKKREVRICWLASRSWQPERFFETLPEWRVCWPPGFGGTGRRDDCSDGKNEFVSHAAISSELLSDEAFLSSCIVPVSSKSWRERALQVFRRCGFVVLRKALCQEDCKSLLQACERAERDMAAARAKKTEAYEPEHEIPGSRGPGRWSFSCASKTGSMLHDPAWVKLLNCEPLLEMLDFLFPWGGKCVAAGGDFVEAGEPAYQHLHSDVLIEGEFDAEFPPPYVSANFVVQQIDSKNGPMRLLPGTQRVSAAVGRRPWLWIPGVEDEPDDWKHSTLQPLCEGDVLLRDVRVLHGGTPNMSAATRFLPSLEFALNEYLKSKDYIWEVLPSMPRKQAETLSERARFWCSPEVWASDLVDTGWR
eukprot:TRINITY_DN60807_c0_g1_i1.p1 TRINITY_DN60807_c0_g1~~TRINITY_DN60807_c0_g1_i1.p1  ORF type:complete len:456 (-),score=92.51 TRINITY_DN60807_c0_g1_i1:86-1453(-)